jgi:acetyl-CoA C-acetyltransferase
MQALFPLEAMGETAENIYELSCAGNVAGGAISREAQDAFALQSQTRAVNAIAQGHFQRETVPVPVRVGKETMLFETDEFPRYTKTANGYELATDMTKLAKLQPAFRKGGTVTAGNSSGLNDGAAALVLMSEWRARELGLKPMARWVASAAAGVDPRTMGLGPVPATRKACIRANIEIEQLDLIELNEAFAVQSIAVLRELGIPESKTNVNGGAIALGHPLGCSGARLMTTLIYEMHRRAALGERMRYGLATLCVGVGQGEATVVERQ